MGGMTIKRIRPVENDDTMPVNTNGGQIGEAYIHGLNSVFESAGRIAR